MLSASPSPDPRNDPTAPPPQTPSQPPQPPDWLKEYFDLGFRVVFFPTRTKGPRDHNWNNRLYTINDYQPNQNVGTLTGTEISAGHYLVDIDLDYAEGVAMASSILPPTEFGFGRASRKLSHVFYTTSAPIITKSFEDIDGHPLVEMRGIKADGTLGFQTMLPHSIHPNGEEIVFRRHGSIAHDDTLPRRAILYAIACMLMKHFGVHGLLHDRRLALAGFLLSNGLNESETILVGETVARATGNDVNDIATTVRTTAARITQHQPVSWKKSLYQMPDARRIFDRIMDWLGATDFIRNARDQIIPNQQNTIRALEQLGVTLRYDKFAEKTLVSYENYNGPLNDMQAIRIRLAIDQQFHFLPTKELYTDIIQNLALDNAFHPVLDYLNSLTWDGIPRISTWLIESAGAEDTDYVHAVSALVLMAAAMRIIRPGCKFDEMLVLESGRQGLLKSSALAKLCPNEDWFSDDLPLGRVESKEIIERTGGKWIIEASELSGYSRDKVEKLKSMLSRQVDESRMSYGRIAEKHPRKFIIIGTTNSYVYLTDLTGNRRFWPVRVGKFNIDWIVKNRDQLWAEAYARAQTEGPEAIRMPPELWGKAEVEQSARLVDDPWRVEIETALLARKYGEDWEENAYIKIGFDELWSTVMPGETRRTPEDAKRLAGVMQSLGFEYKKIRTKTKSGKSKTEYGWARGQGRRGRPKTSEDEDDDVAPVKFMSGEDPRTKPSESSDPDDPDDGEEM